jgi:hypothetical protein
LIDPEDYEETSYRRHQQFILDLLGFQKWEDHAKRLVTSQIRDMVRSQSQAKFIFRHVIDILERRHIELPSSWELSELILDEIKTHKRELTATDDFRTIRDLYRDVEPVINLLDLTPDGIHYYAKAVLKS